MNKEIHRVFDEKLDKWAVKRSDHPSYLNVYKHVEHADNFGVWFSEFDKATFVKYDKNGNKLS